MRLLTIFFDRQFAVFLVVGGTCAAVNFASGAIVRAISTGPLGYAASIVFGFFAGTILSFVLNRRYTFGVGGAPVGPQMARFALVSLASIGLSAAVAEVLLAAFARAAGSPFASESLAHAATIGVMTLFNYTAMKFFALRPEPKERLHA